MANTNAPFGFKPIRTLTGNPVVAVEYPVKASTAVVKNQLLKLDSAGGVCPCVSDAAAQVIVGIALEAQDNSSGALGAKTVLVAPAENLVAAVQLTTYAAADAGQNIKVNSPTAASTVTKISQSFGLLSSGACNSYSVARVIGLGQGLNNAIGSYAVAEVVFPNSVSASVTAV